MKCNVTVGTIASNGEEYKDFVIEGRQLRDVITTALTKSQVKLQDPVQSITITIERVAD